MNLETLYKAIGMRSSTDEKKAINAVNDLKKLYEGLSFDQYGEEDKTKMVDMQKKILAAINKTNGDLVEIGEDIAKLDALMKEAKSKPKPAVYKTKANPTPENLAVVTPTIKPEPKAESKPEAEAKAEAEDEPRNLLDDGTPKDVSPVSSPVSSPPSNDAKTGGKKSKKHRGKRKGRKTRAKKSKKYPRSKKHYNQKGGQKSQGCSPMITPAKVSPYQGFAWKGGNVKTWPGVGGVAGASNFYSPNQYNNQPDRYPDMVSGIYTQ
ncbi:MAG: hypothetical protein ACXABD_03660 [Candidatus Thorarchaeota archaeon]